MKWLFVTLTVVLTNVVHYARTEENGDEKILACYFANWGHYSIGYYPKEYEDGLCTHILYAFAIFNRGTFMAQNFDETDVPGNWKFKEGLYNIVLNYRKRDRKLKVLLSFGGWTFSQEKSVKRFAEMAERKESRKTFIDSAIKLVRKYGFDGIDMDWEYPQEKVNSAIFFREMRAAIDAEAAASGKNKLLFTAAVAAGDFRIKKGYDIPVFNEVLDLAFVMTYDFHGGWEKETGHLAPLYRRRSDKMRRFNTDSALKIWVKGGMDKRKIVVGLATYGRGWVLLDKKRRGVGAKGYATTPDVVSYSDVCKMLKQGAKRYFDKQSKVPYLITKRGEWYTYEDESSIQIKLDYIKRHNYPGAFVWALDKDDWKNTCGRGRYPLIKLMRKELGVERKVVPQKTEKKKKSKQRKSTKTTKKSYRANAEML